MNEDYPENSIMHHVVGDTTKRLKTPGLKDFADTGTSMQQFKDAVAKITTTTNTASTNIAKMSRSMSSGSISMNTISQSWYDETRDWRYREPQLRPPLNQTEREKLQMEIHLLRQQRDDAVERAAEHKTNAEVCKERMIAAQTDSIMAKRRLDAATKLLAEMVSEDSMEAALDSIIQKLVEQEEKRRIGIRITNDAIDNSRLAYASGPSTYGGSSVIPASVPAANWNLGS